MDQAQQISIGDRLVLVVTDHCHTRADDGDDEAMTASGATIFCREPPLGGSLCHAVDIEPRYSGATSSSGLFKSAKGRAGGHRFPRHDVGRDRSSTMGK